MASLWALTLYPMNSFLSFFSMYLAGTQDVPRYFSGEVLKMHIGMPLICLLTPVISDVNKGILLGFSRFREW